MFKRSGEAARRHASEEALLAFADSDAALDPSLGEHIGACTACRSRAAELQRMRRLLQATALRAEAAPREVARGALNRLRYRRAAIGHVNEFIGVLTALLRGFSTLLAGEPPAHDASGDGEKRFTTRG